MNSNQTKIHHVDCACGTPEHMFRVMYFSDEEPRLMYVSMFLQNFSFLKRLWCGIKYILGFKSRYGHFEEIILNNDDVMKLRELCNEFLRKEETLFERRAREKAESRKKDADDLASGRKTREQLQEENRALNFQYGVRPDFSKAKRLL